MSSENSGEQQVAQRGALASEHFPIVCVGASAGGLEACIDLLRHLPPAPGLALVLIQHLDPNHKSLLPEILGRESALPVSAATDGTRVEIDHVYVIPPNHGLTIEDGRLQLMARAEAPQPFSPVDHFLRSLAHDQGARAIAVILSGGGSDGALGLEDIKAADGMVFVQDERTARQDGMPRNAAATGCADAVLAPAEIAQELARVSRQYFSPGAAEVGERLADDKESLKSIFACLRRGSGVDFSQYKRSTIMRRIFRRMGLSRADSLAQYAQLVADQPAEAQSLVQDFLIRVTSFFRDPQSFEVLKEIAFPELMRDRPRDLQVRLWVAGCSTGEEVYSLAIALLEYLDGAANNTPIKILATDVNESALERARQGLYVDNVALDISPERLRRFFSKVNSNYQICKAVRDLCVFSKHNVVKDPPFANLDLISCRNLLIYLDLPLQKRVLPYFHYALKPGGYLMLGSSETVGANDDLFEIRDKEHRIYVKKPTFSRVLMDFPAGDKALSLRRELKPIAPIEGLNASEVQREAERLLLARYVPPGVIVDEHLHILHFRGQVGPYLNPTSGVASLDLLKMLREGLAIEVRDAVEKAKTENAPVRRDDLHINEGGQLRPVSVEVVPLRSASADGPRCFLVLFDRREPAAGEPPAIQLKSSNGQGAVDGSRQLERELAAAHEHLQLVIEENESASEELRAANEEILSSNEELQSTNEELQTAKEEMQSANEELATVNEELNHRNDALGQLNDDLVNLLGGLNLPIVLVNRELRIRRFTTAAESLFNLIPSDVGRPITDLRSNLRVPDFDELLRGVIDKLETKELEVQDAGERWYSLRIRPYITAENKIDGAAIAAVDIDGLKRGAERLKASRDYAEAIVETVYEPLVVLDNQLRVNRANAAFYRAFNVTREDTEDRSFWEIADGFWNQHGLRTLLEKVLPTNRRIRDLEVELSDPQLGTRTLLLNAHRIFWEGSGTQMVLLAIEDISTRKQDLAHATLLAREQAARTEAEAANRAKDEFLAMLAHELRNPLAPIRNTFFILRDRFHDDPVAGHALEMSERQLTHMTRLLDDLLDVSRITRGKTRLHKELVELQSAIRRAVEACREAFDQRKHQLEVSLPPEPLYLEADPARLEQILVNLLNNAAKYTDPGGQIALDARREGEQIVIRLKDNGLGISPEMLPRIFDLFSQADRSLDRSQGGLGIGLTLVRDLVQLHGGTVEAASGGPGRGSEFTVRLPALQLAETRLPMAENASVAPGDSTRRILIVDDNQDAADSMAMALQIYGHEVQVAHDGPSALAAALDRPPEVMLLDIGLPGLSGYEVAKRVRDNPRLAKTTIIAITGYGQAEDRRHAKAAGIDHFLVKPVRLNEVQRIVQELKPHA